MHARNMHLKILNDDDDNKNTKNHKFSLTWASILVVGQSLTKLTMNIKVWP